MNDTREQTGAPFAAAPGSADAPDFISELRDLINKHSMENASNTPDFILAQYLTNCLQAWNQATQQRETWYGRDDRPASLSKEPSDPAHGRQRWQP
jgi:hypothetical protein